MKRKIFKFKIIDGGNSIILTLDYTDLSIDIIRKLTNYTIRLVADKECRLQFIGNKGCQLGLEDIYTLCGLLQAILGDTLIWDIIDEFPKEGEPEDLNGYLILSSD